MRALLILSALLSAAPAAAQAVVAAPDLSPTIATMQTQINTMQAAIPAPANAPPPTENVSPAIGAQTRYAREDHVHPRISRAVTVQTQTGGTFSGTWTTALPSAPAVILTPIAAAASIDCQLTATPTTTGFAGRCWTAQTTTLNLSIITAGLTLNPVASTPAGISIQVIAIPQTQ